MNWIVEIAEEFGPELLALPLEVRRPTNASTGTLPGSPVKEDRHDREP